MNAKKEIVSVDEIIIVEDEAIVKPDEFQTTEVSSSFKEIFENAKTGFSNSSTHANSIANTTTPSRKRSILDTANSDVVSCLNKMFSPELRRGSMMSPATSTSTLQSMNAMRRGSLMSPGINPMKSLSSTTTTTDGEFKELKSRSKFITVSSINLSICSKYSNVYCHSNFKLR